MSPIEPPEVPGGFALGVDDGLTFIGSPEFGSIGGLAALAACAANEEVLELLPAFLMNSCEFMLIRPTKCDHRALF